MLCARARSDKLCLNAQIEEIMTSDDMKFAVSTFEAMNLSKEVKPALKKTQAQTLLESYVAKGEHFFAASCFF